MHEFDFIKRSLNSTWPIVSCRKITRLCYQEAMLSIPAPCYGLLRRVGWGILPGRRQLSRRLFFFFLKKDWVGGFFFDFMNVS